MRKAIVIGLDGGTLDILRPLADRGYIPNLKQLMQDGVWGKLRTVIPPGTGPAWSSIVTGRDPSNHGVFDLIVRADDSYNLAFLNSSSVRAPAVWDVVGGFGGRVLVLNVPMTFPPRQVNGYMVSGLLTPLGSNECTYPRGLLDDIAAIAPGYKIVPTEGYMPGRIERFLDDIEEVVRSKARVLKEFMAREDWQFVMQVFNETDFLQHALWHVMDPDHPRHDSTEHDRYIERIFAVYRQIDGVIGDMIEQAGDEASVVILSDHGHGPLYEFIHANNLLLEAGVMKIKKDVRSRIKHLLFRLGFTPLNVYRTGTAVGLARLRMGLRWTSKGHDLLRRFFFSFSDIDWQRTEAYGLSGGVYGGLFVNLEGREPSGAVSKERYDKVREDLAKIFKELVHPTDGDLLVKETIRREEVYGGTFAEEAPDILFLPRDPTMAVFGDFEFSSNKIVEPASEAISAQHRMEGVFLAKGAGLQQGAEVSGISVLDMAPLLLYLMDLPIPEGLDGRLREDLFIKDAFSGKPPTYCKIEDVPGTATGERRSTEDDSIKQRLKGLGYIS
jgi:predicted AlkP superfamily phosphohydrolase/phosphomutase